MMPRLFKSNPRLHVVHLPHEELLQLCVDSSQHFDALPLFHHGESSEIRRTKIPGLLIQKLVPSLNSISQTRKGTVPGTGEIRLSISEVLWSAIHQAGLASCHLAVHGDCVLITEERVPPVEVIVKAALVGTPMRVYHDIDKHTDRFGKRLQADQTHSPYIRFDYRNPLNDDTGAPLRDECLPPGLADRFIDTEMATRTALQTFDVLRSLFASLRMNILDICLIYDETGQTLCYELSPDNMRVKSTDEATGDWSISFDKDLWRQGHEQSRIIRQWTELRNRLDGFMGEAAIDGDSAFESKPEDNHRVVAE